MNSALTSTGNVTVTVTSNLPPSDITLSSAVVTENTAGANMVRWLSPIPTLAMCIRSQLMIAALKSSEAF